MIKVYEYGLNNIYIVDKENKKHGVQFLHNGMKIDRGSLKRVTKATINKYLKDFETHRHDTYLITSPILSTFTNGDTQELHAKRSAKDHLITVNSYEELENYFEKLYTKTKNVRKKHHFVNFESSLMAVLKHIKNNEIRLDYKELDILKQLKEQE
jgi:hypothetical protein